MVNKKLVGIVVAIVLIVVAGISIFGGFGTDSATDVVKSGVTRDCSSTPWVVAQSKGYFEKYGVDFKDVGEIAAPQRPAAFISGQTNVVADHPNNVINLIKSGAKIKAVAVSDAEPIGNNSTMSEHMHFHVKETGLIQSVDDLKNFKEDNGRKIRVAVVATGVCADLEFNAYARKIGLSKDDYEFVVLADNQQEQALLQGEIDVSSMHPPFFLKAETDSNETDDPDKKVKTLFTSTDAFGPAAGMTLIAFDEDYIKKNPDTVRDFVKAFKDAERWSNDNRDEAGELTADFIDLPYTSNVHWYSPSGAFNNESIGYLQQWIDAMVTDGQLKEGEITPEDIIIYDFNDTWETDLPNN